jgi:hypothetical protein
MIQGGKEQIEGPQNSPSQARPGSKADDGVTNLRPAFAPSNNSLLHQSLLQPLSKMLNSGLMANNPSESSLPSHEYLFWAKHEPSDPLQIASDLAKFTKNWKKEAKIQESSLENLTPARSQKCIKPSFGKVLQI